MTAKFKRQMTKRRLSEIQFLPANLQFVFKLNHEPQASGFTAKFWTFYGVILLAIRV